MGSQGCSKTAKAAQITLDFAMGLCATRGDRCPWRVAAEGRGLDDL